MTGHVNQKQLSINGGGSLNHQCRLL